MPRALRELILPQVLSSAQDFSEQNAGIGLSKLCAARLLRSLALLISQIRLLHRFPSTGRYFRALTSPATKPHNTLRKKLLQQKRSSTSSELRFSVPKKKVDRVLAFL